MDLALLCYAILMAIQLNLTGATSLYDKQRNFVGKRDVQVTATARIVVTDEEKRGGFYAGKPTIASSVSKRSRRRYKVIVKKSMSEKVPFDLLTDSELSKYMTIKRELPFDNPHPQEMQYLSMFIKNKAKETRSTEEKTDSITNIRKNAMSGNDGDSMGNFEDNGDDNEESDDDIFMNILKRILCVLKQGSVGHLKYSKEHSIRCFLKENFNPSNYRERCITGIFQLIWDRFIPYELL